MLNNGIPIGRIFGISVRLHFSWFIIFALVIWTLSRDYFPSIYPFWSTTVCVSAAIVTSLLFFASLLAHELSHSLVAQHYGIKVKAITLFIFGGVAQITEEPHEARTEFRIAVAGPLTSIVLGGIFWGLWFILPQSFDILAAISIWLGWTNIVLAVFNLVPGFPLDGGRVLRSLIWWRSGNLHRATRLASNFGRGIGFLIIFAGFWLALKDGDWSSGLWIALIGWFLASTAASSYQQMALQQGLEGHAVSEVVSGGCVAIAPELSIELLINEYIGPTGSRCFAVARDGITLGLVTLQEVKGVLRDMRARVSVGQIMQPMDKLARVTPEDSLSSVLNILAQQKLGYVPVMAGGRISGIITRENLINFARQRKNTNA